MTQNWEDWKRQRIMTYPKRRNKKIIIGIVVFIIIIALISGIGKRGCCSKRKCNTTENIIK